MSYLKSVASVLLTSGLFMLAHIFNLNNIATSSGETLLFGTMIYYLLLLSMIFGWIALLLESVVLILKMSAKRKGL